MNKDTMMMVSIALAFFAVFYIYRELQSTKLQLQKMSEPVPVPVAAPVPVQTMVQVPVQVPVKIEKKKEPAGETVE